MTPSKQTNHEMYPLVERYLASQQTQKAFCAEHGLSVTKLNYWRAKYRRQNNDGAFLEITPGTTPTEQPLLEIVYPHGVRLRLFAPLAPASLERLIGLPRP
jgi:hypothetical protein